MSDSRSGKVVSKAEFARLVGFSQKQVGNWCEEGMPHIPGARGKAVRIDTAGAVQWLIDRAVRKELGGKSAEAGPTTGLSGAREDLLRHQATSAKLAAEERAGNLISAELVGNAIRGLAASVSAALDGAAGRIAGGDAVLRKRLLDEHRRIRSEIARRVEALGHSVGGGADAEPAPRARRVGVGRRESRPTK